MVTGMLATFMVAAPAWFSNNYASAYYSRVSIWSEALAPESRASKTIDVVDFIYYLISL